MKEQEKMRSEKGFRNQQPERQLKTIVDPCESSRRKTLQSNKNTEEHLDEYSNQTVEELSGSISTNIWTKWTPTESDMVVGV